MIKGNIIEFGYGDVVVGANWIKSCLTITNIDPSLKCGDVVKEEMICNLVFEKSIEIYEDNIHDIYNLICSVNQNNKVVKYNNWIFDFSKYNEESVRVVRDKAYNIINILCLAC